MATCLASTQARPRKPSRRSASVEARKSSADNARRAHRGDRRIDAGRRAGQHDELRAKSTSRSSGPSRCRAGRAGRASPSCSRLTRGARAISAAPSTAAAVSRTGATAIEPIGSRCASSASARTVASAASWLAEAVPATQTPVTAGPTTRVHVAVAELARVDADPDADLRSPAFGVSQSRTAARASCFPVSGGIASARSMTTASAPICPADPNRSGESPGTNSKDLTRSSCGVNPLFGQKCGDSSCIPTDTLEEISGQGRYSRRQPWSVSVSESFRSAVPTAGGRRPKVESKRRH